MKFSRVSGWCAMISGFVSVLGIVFLALFSMGNEKFGPLNDIAVIIQYVLMMPIAIYFFRLWRSAFNRIFNTLVLGVGILGMVTVVGLQVALVWGWMPFHQQILWVIPAFLTVLGWFLLIQFMGKQTGLFPFGWWLAALAGLYIGYPVWAYRVGKHLLMSSATKTEIAVKQ